MKMQNLFFIFAIILIYFNSIATASKNYKNKKKNIHVEVTNLYDPIMDQDKKMEYQDTETNAFYLDGKVIEYQDSEPKRRISTFNQNMFHKLRDNLGPIKKQASKNMKPVKISRPEQRMNEEYLFEDEKFRKEFDREIKTFLENNYEELLHPITPKTNYNKDVKILEEIELDMLKYLDVHLWKYDDKAFEKLEYIKNWKQSMNEPLYMIQTHLLEHYYNKKYPELRKSLNLKHNKVMQVTKLLKQFGWTYGAILWFVTTLPACSFWKEHHGESDLSPWKYNLNGAPLFIATFWSLYLTIPLMVGDNLLVPGLKMTKSSYDVPSPSLLSECCSKCMEKYPKWVNFLTLNKTRKHMGSFLHMTNEFLKGNQLWRGFWCFVGMVGISNLAMYAAEPISMHRIPPYENFEVLLSVHYVFLGCKAVAIDLFGVVKGWHIHNVVEDSYGSRDGYAWLRKLTVDFVLSLSLFTIKFMKAFLVGVVTRWSELDLYYNRKLFSILRYIFTPGFNPSTLCNTLKKLMPPIVSIMIVFEMLHAIMLHLKSEGSRISGDFGDMEGVPLYIAGLYMVQLLNWVGYKTITFGVDEMDQPILTQTQDWKFYGKQIKNSIGNNGVKVFYTFLSILFTAGSYYTIHPYRYGEGQGVRFYEDWFSPIIGCVWTLAAYWSLFLLPELGFTLVETARDFSNEHRIQVQEINEEEEEKHVEWYQRRFNQNVIISVVLMFVFIIDMASKSAVTGEFN